MIRQMRPSRRPTTLRLGEHERACRLQDDMLTGRRILGDESYDSGEPRYRPLLLGEVRGPVRTW